MDGPEQPIMGIVRVVSIKHIEQIRLCEAPLR